jgi:hypothetical protein
LGAESIEARLVEINSEDMDERPNTKGFIRIITIVETFLLVLMAGATLTQAAQSTQVVGTFQLKISQGYLSLEATEASLVQIFQEIGKQGKITFDSNIGPEEKITIRLERVPLEDGIRQLAKNVTIFYTENPKDKTRRISRIVVVSEGKESVPVQTKTSPQPENVKEPAPQTATKKPAAQPEPFKFEFDPGKFDGKEKAGK